MGDGKLSDREIKDANHDLRYRSRSRAIEDALLELSGPSGKELACRENTSCANGHGMPDAEHRSLYDDLSNLAKATGGQNSRNFKEDLDWINNRLRVDYNILLNLDGFGPNSHKYFVRPFTPGPRYQIAREDGMLTLKSMGAGRVDLVGHFKPELSLSHAKPDPYDVIQGNIGDCYFLATASALAQRDPDSLVRMIKENKDGSFTVTFPGQKDNPITIKRPNDAEMKYFAYGDQLKWIHVLEKAHRKLQGKTLYDPGSQQSSAMELLTGEKPISKQMKVERDSHGVEEAVSEMDSILKTLMKKQMPVVAATQNWGDDFNSKNDGVLVNHSYTVLDYDATKKLVTVRNPNGVKAVTEKFPSVGAGAYVIPLDRFVKDFNEVTTTARNGVKDLDSINTP